MKINEVIFPGWGEIMIKTEHYDKAFVLHQNGEVIGEIDNFSFDGMGKLGELEPYLLDGDIIRCFSDKYTVKTYIIRKEKGFRWPEIYKMEEFDRVFVQ